VPDQDVTLTVFAQRGAASNDLSVHFTATRDPFTRITCSTSVGAGNSDQCQDWGQDNWPLECGCRPNWDARRDQATALLKQAATVAPLDQSRLEKQAADLLAPTRP
jgi:hypothetical protein